VRIDRGTFGPYPYAAVGAGAPVVVLAGLSPNTGVDGNTTVRGSLSPLRRVAATRRLVVLNRRPGLPRGLTMAEFAAEHADALRAAFGGTPVDLVGLSTGGSIAAQLAADHPDVVRRLVLLSAACRLGPLGRRLQADCAAAVRRADTRSAAAIAGAGLMPFRPLKPLARLAARLGSRRMRDEQAWNDLATTIEAEDGFDLARCATPIAAPTLIGAGAKDRFYGRELFEETARLIPRSQLVLIPGRGHITALGTARLTHSVAGFLAHTG
jgi:pimeloyl-ACP methyl ester carboxylesterase